MLTPISDDELINQTFDGQYTVEAKLGVGSTGTVYRARHILLGDQVAIKIIHPELVSDQEATKIFRRGVRTVRMLRHPNAAMTYDFRVISSGIVYLVMELVEGQSLRDLIRRQGPFTLRHAYEIIEQVCIVLDVVHSLSIVHRDLKSNNIFVNPSRDGLRVKVLDFEIGKLRDLTTGKMPRMLNALDVPYYLSPEQCLGKELDSRSDIYSLGVVLYEMLTGVVPFEGPDWMSVLEKHMHSAPPSLRLFNPGITPAVEAVVLRSLAKQRQERPQSAQALAGEFARAAVPEMSNRPSQVEIPAKPLYADEDVQFTVYAPQTIKPEKIYALLAFAHLSAPRFDADEDECHPIEEMKEQASRILGNKRDDYRDFKEPGRQPVPRGGELTFVPFVQGITFSPPSRSFSWRKSVHREEFDMWASNDVDGRTLSGRLTVFLGSVIIAELELTIVVNRTVDNAREKVDKPVSGRRLRQIFTSYSHKDESVVRELAHVAPIFGTRYLMDRTHLEPGEDWRTGLQRLIRAADVFQLFWSTNSMRSQEVAAEIAYAISLRRANFILPTYWEEPLPRSPREGLPPADIDRLHFYRIYPGGLVKTPEPTNSVSYSMPASTGQTSGEFIVGVDTETLLREAAEEAEELRRREEERRQQEKEAFRRKLEQAERRGREQEQRRQEEEGARRRLEEEAAQRNLEEVERCLRELKERRAETTRPVTRREPTPPSNLETRRPVKRCSTCNRIYVDVSLNFCLEDGTTLVTTNEATFIDPTIAVLNSEAPTRIEPPQSPPTIARQYPEHYKLPSYSADRSPSPPARSPFILILGVATVIFLLAIVGAFLFWIWLRN